MQYSVYEIHQKLFSYRMETPGNNEKNEQYPSILLELIADSTKLHDIGTGACKQSLICLHFLPGRNQMQMAFNGNQAVELMPNGS
jgi:hypothetical protein